VRRPGWRDKFSAAVLYPESAVGRPDCTSNYLPLKKTFHAARSWPSSRSLRRQLVVRSRWCGIGTVSTAKARLVQAFLAEHPTSCRRFPGISRTQPDESVWSWTKYGRLSNLAAWDAQELWDHSMSALIDLKFQPQSVTSFHPQCWNTSGRIGCLYRAGLSKQK